MYPSVREMTDAQRISIVKEIFSTITDEYDFVNQFISLRRNVFWRRFAVREMRFFQTNRFLDVATGTADLAIEAARHHPHISVVGLDFTDNMMVLGGKKVARKGLSTRLRLVKGDALYLPFAAGCFDGAAIAFGIRNIPDKFQVLREMMRVVVPGGSILVLEMSDPQPHFLRPLYHLYLKKILPSMAMVLSQNPGSYRYLGDSIIHFPSPVEFKRQMEEAGLVNVTMYPLTLGICHLHVGYKPALEAQRASDMRHEQ